MTRRWPDRFDALRSGVGCPMCDRPEADLTQFGARFFVGEWSDAVLGRHPVRPGYAFVAWKGRHVTEPDEHRSLILRTGLLVGVLFGPPAPVYGVVALTTFG